MPRIVIVNACHIVPDAEVAAYTAILQQFDDDVLAPAWSLARCTYEFEPWNNGHPKLPPADGSVWPIFLNNHSDDPGALGYHDDQRGLIFGRVFVGDDKAYGVDWRTDLSHEVFETRGDPTINRTVTLPDGRIAMVELCDPVEDDSVAISYKGSIVSNFVLPRYFDPAVIGGGPFDYGGYLSLPCPALTAGGYQSLFVGGKWTQVLERRADGTVHPRAFRPGRSYKRAGGMR